MGEMSQPPRPGAELLHQAMSDLDALQNAVGGVSRSAVPGRSEHTDRLRDLVRLARQVTSILDLRPLLDAVLEVFVSITRAERGFVMLSDPAGQIDFHATRELAAYNVDRDQLGDEEYEISRGAVLEVAASGRSVFVEDVLTQGNYGSRQSVIELKLRSLSCVPLLSNGRVIGVCYTDSRQPSASISESNRGLLEMFAAQAAIAIGNARRHGDLLDAKSRLEAENLDLRRQIQRQSRFANILGESPVMQRLFDLLARVVPANVNVLVQGETGTGKELVARALHYNGPLREGPWVTLNAGALPANLLESELFGHRRGSFTGALENRPGIFAQAHNGTLFLDEVGEMPLELQVKLLRVLQDGEVKAVGEDVARKVNVRVVAATNRDLAEEVRQERFREDLFYRLNVVCIEVPPLRERGNDILLLAEEFARLSAKKNDKVIRGFTPDAARWLLEQHWEGNVRQLQNCIERAVTLSENGARLDAGVLSSPLGGTRAATSRPVRSATLRQTLEGVERQEVEAALRASAGNRSNAARQLGVSRQHLHNLVRKHSISVPKEL